MEIAAFSALVGFAAGVATAGFVAAVPGAVVAGAWAKPALALMMAMPADSVRLAPRCHCVRRDDVDYAVFCFAEASDTDLFRERFSGERFDPQERGRARPGTGGSSASMKRRRTTGANDLHHR